MGLTLTLTPTPNPDPDPNPDPSPGPHPGPNPKQVSDRSDLWALGLVVWEMLTGEVRHP